MRNSTKAVLTATLILVAGLGLLVLGLTIGSGREGQVITGLTGLVKLVAFLVGALGLSYLITHRGLWRFVTRMVHKHWPRRKPQHLVGLTGYTREGRADNPFDEVPTDWTGISVPLD